MEFTVEDRHSIKSCTTAEVVVVHACVRWFLSKDSMIVD